jgi:hypothetical protein
VKRSAAQYAVLSRLLDELLAVDECARDSWLALLPAVHESQRSVLNRMLALDNAIDGRKLDDLEAHLRSSARAVHELCDCV